MAILAMTSHGQDARATSKWVTVVFSEPGLAGLTFGSCHNWGGRMVATVATFVDDLFFLAKIRETAKAVGVAVVSPDGRARAALSEPAPQAIFLDLGSRTFPAIEKIRTLKADPITAHIPIIAFASHVQTELISNARAAGCDMVMARSAFTERLPELLRRLAQGEEIAVSQG
jgi:DNA-binding NarL/FixJ family response regulator